MRSKGAIYVTAGPHNGTISFQQYGMTGMRLDGDNVACDRDKHLGRFQLSITILSAMRKSLDEKGSIACDEVVRADLTFQVTDNWRPGADVDALRVRAQLCRTIREYFHELDVLEVLTPTLGQRTVTDTGVSASPRPKCARGSLLDR